MKKNILLLTLILPFIISCNMTLLNRKDYKIKSDDLIWKQKIENQVGEIYLENSNIIYGRNWDSTFIVLSPETGSISTTLMPYKVIQERECLILDKTAEYKSGYALFNIPVDKNKYSKVTLKTVDRKYRGDNETFYLIVKTTVDKELTVLFDPQYFTSIADIIHLKDGKFIIKYNGEAQTENNNYFNYVGLFDLDKIIN